LLTLANDLDIEVSHSPRLGRFIDVTISGFTCVTVSGQR